MSMATALPYASDVPVPPTLADALVAIRERKQVSLNEQAQIDAERDRLIRAAYAEDGGVREIARLVGLSHTAVMQIVAEP
jgi:hypothetical protein